MVFSVSLFFYMKLSKIHRKGDVQALRVLLVPWGDRAGTIPSTRYHVNGNATIRVLPDSIDTSAPLCS